MTRQNIIVAGGRDFQDYDLLVRTLDKLRSELKGEAVIVSGCDKGAVSLGERYAEERNLQVLRFPPNWRHHRNAARYIRDNRMIAVADGVVAFWDGKSKETASVIKISQKRGIPLLVVRYQ